MGSHSKPVNAWLTLYKEQMEILYLPSYSPELNPDEGLNADLNTIGSKVPVRTKKKLKGAAYEHITMLEQSPERVKFYFQDPRIRYAAERLIHGGSIIVMWPSSGYIF